MDVVEKETERVVTEIGERVIQTASDVAGKTDTTKEEVADAISKMARFYGYITSSQQEEARQALENLWEAHKGKVWPSTRVDEPKEMLDTRVNNERLRDLMQCIDDKHQGMILLALNAKKLIKEGKHEESDEVETKLYRKHGEVGENIFKIITSGDIDFLLEEVEGKAENEKKQIFEEWIEGYKNISLFISPVKLERNPQGVVESIVETYENTIRDFMIIHCTGTPEGIEILKDIVEAQRKQRKIDYSNLDYEIIESGEYVHYRVKLRF